MNLTWSDAKTVSMADYRDSTFVVLYYRHQWNAVHVDPDTPLENSLSIITYKSRDEAKEACEGHAKVLEEKHK